MSRWRPPMPRSAPYITLEGYQRLNAELKYLWKEKRPEVTQAVKEAAAQGDRSENAEYIYGKKQLREIDRRIRYLSKRLDGITVVDRTPDDPSTIFFGAWVTLEDEQGNRAPAPHCRCRRDRRQTGLYQCGCAPVAPAAEKTGQRRSLAEKAGRQRGVV